MTHPRTTRDPLAREFLLASGRFTSSITRRNPKVYGQWMLEELQHHGYRLSPGTSIRFRADGASRMVEGGGAETRDRSADLPHHARR